MTKLIVTKPKQIKAWIDNNKLQWEFWDTVVRNETWAGLNKTKLVEVVRRFQIKKLEYSQTIVKNITKNLLRMVLYTFSVMRV